MVPQEVVAEDHVKYRFGKDKVSFSVRMDIVQHQIESGRTGRRREPECRFCVGEEDVIEALRDTAQDIIEFRNSAERVVIEIPRKAVVRERFFEVPVRFERLGQVEIGSGVIRIQFDGFAQRVDRRFGVPVK